MNETYHNAADAQGDRRQLRDLLAALNAWDRALRRDECNAWRISGTSGCIYTWGDGKTWVLHIACRSSRHWAATKERLAFCAVTQDGDDEGCLRLHAVPTKQQAEAIREALSIRKRREYAPEELERLRTSVRGRFPAEKCPVLHRTGIITPKTATPAEIVAGGATT
jgi:hypothetical protein